MPRGVLRAGLNRLSQLLLFGEGDAEIGDRYEGAEQYRRRQAEFDRGHAPVASEKAAQAIGNTAPHPRSGAIPGNAPARIDGKSVDVIAHHALPRRRCGPIGAGRVRYVSVVRTVPAVEYYRFGFLYRCPFS